MEKKSSFSRSDWLSHPEVLWEDHTEEVCKHGLNFSQSLPESLFQPLSRKAFDKAVEICCLLHDLGKTTTYFQEYIRKRREKSFLSSHAGISALVTFWVMENWVSREELANQIHEALPIMAYEAVLCHHRNLDWPVDLCSLSEEKVELIQDQWQSIDKQKLSRFWKKHEIPLEIEKVGEKIENLPDSFKRSRRRARKMCRETEDFSLYFLTNTLFSLLIDGDKSSAGLGSLPPTQKLPGDLIDQYRSLMGWNEDKNDFDFEKGRNRSYRETLQQIIPLSKSNRILSLQLPTGFGKTLTALSAALKLREERDLERVIYCLPFTAIIDQNFSEIQSVLERVLQREVNTNTLLKHHYLSDVFYKTDEEEYDSLQSNLLMEGWNSFLIITTFVQFFHTLIGWRNRTLRKFHRLARSVVILDEIQAIPPKYWLMINRILSELAQRFDSYFILVTATQPLIFKPTERIDLVEPEKYYQSLKRVSLYPELDPAQTLDQYQDFVQERINEGESAIAIFNTIRSARQFYHKISPQFPLVRFLSSHIVPKHRLRIIESLREEREYFLVTTQLIEAGVNLDADVVFRDLAPLDSIHQAAGRCNRYGVRRGGRVYVVVLKEEDKERTFSSYIYDPVLLHVTRAILGKEEIPEGHFYEANQRYFEEIYRKFPQDDAEEFLRGVKELRYDNSEGAISSFRLIEENYEKLDVFVEVDEEAREIWEKYSSLGEIKNFWHRRAEYLKIKNLFQSYIISVSSKDLKKNQPPLQKGLFYIPHIQIDQFYDGDTGFKIEDISHYTF